MKTRHIVLVVLILVMMGVYYYKDRSQTVDSVDADSSEETQVANPYRPSPSQAQNEMASTDLTTAVLPIQNPENQPISEAVQKRFAVHMVNLEKCLRLSSASATLPVLQPTSDQLMAQLRGSLGEPVVQLEDWTQFDVIDKVGVKKRIRVDYDYPDGATPNRRLSSYTLNSYGSYEIDNLTNDQSDNPNEAYVESLKEGQRLTQEEKSSRFYFSQGEELIVSLKNGRLTSMSVTRGEYAYNCNNLSEETSVCTCP
jgi:hypothetical protein